MDQREYKYTARSRRGRRVRRNRRGGQVLLLVPVVCLLLSLCAAGLEQGGAAAFPRPEEGPAQMGGRVNASLSSLAADAADSAREHEWSGGLDTDDWQLLLVNPWNPLPEDYEPPLTGLKNGLFVDSRCYPDLRAMMEACRADGLSPVICSAYRTQEYQEQLFQSKVNRLVVQGYAAKDAAEEAGKSVAVPGTSEHQLGLAVDIVDMNNQHLDESQEGTAVQRWLMEHSWEYGFILRYPSGKSELTGISYEPWHYRYVGCENAGQIYELGVCLEEYLEETP